MAANRFDQLLPLQPIPRESLYVPFRIKDNTDTYAALFKALQKEDKTKKLSLSTFKNYEKPEITQSINYSTGYDILLNNSTVNLDYETLSNAVSSINEYKANLLNKTLATAIDKGIEIGYTDIISINQAINNLNNDPVIKMIDASKKNIASQIEQNIGNNSEITGQNYSKLIQASLYLRNGILPPEIHLSKQDNKTYNEYLKEFTTSVKPYSFDVEGGLEQIGQLQILDDYILMFGTEGIEQSGSIYNPSLKRLSELTSTEKKIHEMRETAKFNALQRVYGTSKDGIYSTLGELYVISNSDFIQGSDVINKNFKIGLSNEEFLSKQKEIRNRYKEIEEQVYHDFNNYTTSVISNNRYNFNNDLSDPNVSKYVNKKIEEYNSTMIKNGTPEKVISLKKGEINGKVLNYIDEFYREEREKIIKDKDAIIKKYGINEWKKRYKNITERYLQFKRDFYNFADEYYEGLYLNEKGEGLDSDIRRTIGIANSSSRRALIKAMEDFEISTGLYTDNRERTYRNYSTEKVDLDEGLKQNKGKGGRGSGENNEYEKGLLFKYNTFVTSTDNRRVLSSANELTIPYTENVFKNTDYSNTLAILLNNPDQETVEKIKKSGTFHVYAVPTGNGNVKIKFKYYSKVNGVQVEEDISNAEINAYLTYDKNGVPILRGINDTEENRLNALNSIFQHGANIQSNNNIKQAFFKDLEFVGFISNPNVYNKIKASGANMSYGPDHLAYDYLFKSFSQKNTPLNHKAITIIYQDGKEVKEKKVVASNGKTLKQAFDDESKNLHGKKIKTIYVHDYLDNPLNNAYLLKIDAINNEGMQYEATSKVASTFHEKEDMYRPDYYTIINSPDNISEFIEKNLKQFHVQINRDKFKKLF